MEIEIRDYGADRASSEACSSSAGPVRTTPRRSPRPSGSASTPTGRGRPEFDPPPTTLEALGIRERLARPSTWALLALEPAASRPATSGSPRRASATSRGPTSPAWRTCGCCSCARRGGGAGWRRGCTASRSRRPPRRATSDAPRTRRRGNAAGARLLRARGLAHRRGRVPRAAARARPRRVPRAICEDPAPCSADAGQPTAPTLSDRAAPLIEEAAERSRVSMRTRVERLRLAWRSIFQASVSAAAGVADRHQGARPPAAVLRARVGDHHARHHASTSAAGGPPSSRSAWRSGSRSPTCWCSRSARAPSQLALVVALATVGRDLPRQRADARQPGGGLGRARGHAAAADRTASRSPASSTR